MTFNSIDFLLFFPVVTGIYLCIPRKLRCIWLLVCSYWFYMAWNPKYALLIAFSTAVTYVCGLGLDKASKAGNAPLGKWILFLCAIVNLGILAVFKYGNFFLANVSALLSAAGFGVIERRLDLLLPVGISFSTFQALSYTFDVYRGRIAAERSFLRYALFVSFFPQLVAGPIERSGNLLPQIDGIEQIRVWDAPRMRDGFLLMMWGFFQKLIIADRASILVEHVIQNADGYGFAEIAVAAVFFALQIYCDFGGYTNIARGAAAVLGFRLMNNFRQPYLAENIKDFWRRWHISLTTWFTDYLYIPLGGNRKGELRKCLNILIVFTVSGLWHGASWNYVAWGLLHGIYRVAEEVASYFGRKRGRASLEKTGTARRLVNIVFTFLLVDFAWIFFVSGSLSHALFLLRQMSRHFVLSGFQGTGFGKTDLICLAFGVLLLFAVDLLHEKKISVFALAARQNVVVRWALYIGLIWAVILLRPYGDQVDGGAFIYFQF